MENKLIPTNGIWYKIKSFFKNLFFKNRKYTTKRIDTKTKQNTNDSMSNNVKQKFQEDNKKQILAEKLLYGEIGIRELTGNEVNDMTEYFRRDIQNIDNELLIIKSHIKNMQQQLKEE